ncbi:hypothetical protein [Paenibacillus sp. 453mf]|uniref:hypothetical protein n=1 Tax=Paenibacillus sp. 453mf TaxID=1761874 RepID=UPI0008E7C3D7|nr:hypothetical protein [Paenibacillus sp. 453mf]SFS76072.1 hypothetical protein SAMN04488601_10333 [Paenibacillus sp. 453mf]
MESPSITDWIQAIFGVLTGLLALITYSLSRKVYHGPSLTFLRPIKLKSNNEHQVEIILFNAGPGIAFNVNVKSLYIKRRTTVGNMLFYDDGYTRTIGEPELQSNSQGNYTFETHLLQLQAPFIITWETVTGKKLKSYWRYGNVLNEIDFYKLSRWGIFLFKLKRIIANILTPYYRLKKRYLEEREKQKRTLNIK